MTSAPLPSLQERADELDLRLGGPIDDLLDAALRRPLADLRSRPCKRVRGRLVERGFELAAGRAPEGWERRAVDRLVEAIELLHAGSLAVDDIQDGSRTRRGQPSLHVRYGVPVALNLGNWLYFRPLEMIHELGLPVEAELSLFRLYHRTMARAHVGQALDVGVSATDLPRERVKDVCLAAIELKSGALFSLALLMGATVAGASPQARRAIDDYGRGLGAGLQMFDDLGNVLGRVEPAKRWEDLILRRPTWAWACAASLFPAPIYDQFVEAVRALPEARPALEAWFERTDFFTAARAASTAHLERCHGALEEALPSAPASAIAPLRALGDEISKAYG